MTEGAAKKVLIPTGAGDLNGGGFDWTEPGFSDSSWASGSGGVGYERSSGYDSYFNIDVEAGMYNVVGSALIRIPFTLTASQVADIGCLTLRVRYDDGFAAYLNGVKITSVNAPGSPEWNSFATNNHLDASAICLPGFHVDS